MRDIHDLFVAEVRRFFEPVYEVKVSHLYARQRNRANDPIPGGYETRVTVLTEQDFHHFQLYSNDTIDRMCFDGAWVDMAWSRQSVNEQLALSLYALFHKHLLLEFTHWMPKYLDLIGKTGTFGPPNAQKKGCVGCWLKRTDNVQDYLNLYVKPLGNTQDNKVTLVWEESIVNDYGRTTYTVDTYEMSEAQFTMAGMLLWMNQVTWQIDNLVVKP